MRSGREVVIVEAVRTPIGRGHPEKGAFKDLHANELLGSVLTAVVERAGIEPRAVDELLTGCVQQLGEQMSNVARNAWLQAELPIETAATTLDFQCGSGQQAANLAAASIAAGVNDCMIAAGVEHMSRLPMDVGMQWIDEVGTPWPPELLARYDLSSQGTAAELIARRWDVSRTELDELALASHRRAEAATREGRFAREIVPLTSGGTSWTTDQGIRPDTSLEALAALRPVFAADGRMTAGNSSQISDGAAALLLMASERADALGLRPRARIVDQTAVGVDPVTMLTGPIPATRRLLERNGLAVGDVDLFEVNEAFASVVAAWQRELGADWERVNVNGGAIALGHPLGSTGARLLTTLVHELERRDAELGIAAMCCGGGLGTATLVRRIA